MELSTHDCPKCKGEGRIDGERFGHEGRHITFTYACDACQGRGTIDAHCGECLDSGDSCRECCPHDETDHGLCLDCGADRMEDLIARAELASDLARDR